MVPNRHKTALTVEHPPWDYRLDIFFLLLIINLWIIHTDALFGLYEHIFDELALHVIFYAFHCSVKSDHCSNFSPKLLNSFLSLSLVHLRKRLLVCHLFGLKIKILILKSFLGRLNILNFSHFIGLFRIQLVQIKRSKDAFAVI